MVMVAFYNGAIIGALIGVVVMALLVTAKDAGQKAEDLLPRSKNCSHPQNRSL